MATKPVNREISALLDDLRFLGYAVVDVGQRWRVTSPEGGNPVFVPASSNGRNKDIAGVLALLADIGYSPERVAEAREKERQERLQADRLRAEKALAEASRKAALASPFVVAAKVNSKATPERQPGVRPTDDDIVTDVMEDLDAEVAKALIQMNKFYTASTNGKERNRSVSRERVIEYAKAMLRGAWLPHNQGIGVDINGVLVDGQKRLLALILATDGIVEAGDRIITLPDVQPNPRLTIPIQITWNLPSEAKYVVDKGQFRSVADELGMAGEVNAHVLGALVKLVIVYDSGKPWASWGKQSVSAQEILDKLDSEPALRDAVRHGHAAGKLMVHSAAAGGAYICLRAYPGGPMNDFLHGIKTGENLAIGDPRLALREHLRDRATASRAQARRGDSVVMMALFIKAWNDFATGTPRKLVRFADNEVYPEPYTPKVEKAKRTTK